MDRASADEDVAVVDPPSTSGAHWANRDNDALYRRPGRQMPFRRPLAVAPHEPPAASFPPESTEAPEEPGWFDAAGANRGRPGAGSGELIVGPGHDVRQHRASRRPAFEPAPPWDPPKAARPARRPRTVMIATIALTAIVLTVGAVAGVMLFSGSDRSLDSVLRLGGGAGGRTATAPLGGRTTASFELLAATTRVTVKAQDLGGDLYRITSAKDSGTVPSPVLAKNRVQLHLVPEGTGATGKVTVLLSSKVKWTLRFVGGADQQVVDLRGGRIGSIDVLGAARRLQLVLPTPTGTVPVRITGAVEDLSITAPQDSPVRARLDGGAKTAAAGERTLRDVQPGSTLTPKGWQTRNRYDVQAESRITLLSIASR